MLFSTLVVETGLNPFCSGMNTWEEIFKKLKDHENSTFHKKCFSQWMLLKDGIRE